MLIRVSGGSSGISAYLADGKKSGRSHNRNELDQRIQLHGNLNELDSVLDSFDHNGNMQKYFHITLSFKESNISEEILREIDKDFHKFIFAACAENEFYYHSEIHFPKIKSLLDTHGKSYPRFPHIHVVIPEFNLYTGKRDNPLGLVSNISHYINAFQEVSNEKYSLESPKDNIRNISIGREEILSRYEINPDMSNKEIKEKIFSIIREHQEISTVEELASVIRVFGEVTIRNSEKFGQSYINLKIHGKSKGINLKDPVFLSDYLANRDIKITHQYSHQSNQKLLDEWLEYAALAARFVEKAPRLERESYSSMTLDEKKSWLYQRWQKHLENIGLEVEPTEITYEIPHEHTITSHAHIHAIPHIDELTHIDEIRHIDEIQHIDDIIFFDELPLIREINEQQSNSDTQRSGGFNLHELRIRGGHGNRGQQRISFAQDLLQNMQFNDLDGTEKICFEELYSSSNADNYSSTKRIIDALEQRQDKQHSDWSSLINAIDSREFLNYLSYYYGLDATNLKIEMNKLGHERIVADGKRYSVSDFLTKKMNFTWSEAKSILQTVSEQQQLGEQQNTAVTSRILWQRFIKHESNIKQLSDLKKEYYAKRQFIRQNYTYHHQPEISRGENNAKRRLMNIQKQAELAQAKAEYEEKRRYLCQRPHERYMEYLYEEAEKGNKAALGELNRIYPIRSIERDVFEIFIKDKKQPKQVFSPVDMGLQVQIQRNGTIAYKDEQNKTVIVDTYRSIKVIERNAETIAKALELAKLRYGINGFEIRNASEKDIAAIQAAVIQTGTEISLIANNHTIDNQPKLNRKEYER